LSILLKVADVTLLESTDGLLVLSLHLCEGLVPTLVEILILHQVSLLDLFALSSLVKDQLLTTTIEILDLKLLNAVLSHLGLDVLAFHLTLFAMFLEDGTRNMELSTNIRLMLKTSLFGEPIFICFGNLSAFKWSHDSLRKSP
jgi:hypothetical protein